MNYSKKIWQLVIISTVFRLIIAGFLYFGIDEVYYRAYANELQLNYFDHPPMVALLIKLTTLNLYLDNELFARLGPVLLAAINTFLIFRCGELLRNQRTGYFAALLYTANIFTSVIAGVFILPDAPHLFFWLAALYQLLRIIAETEGSRKINKFLIYFAVLSGLAFLSKVYAVFLWFGFIMYIITVSPKMLKLKRLYLSMALASFFLLPVIVWNIQNDFVTFKFHGERVNVAGSSFSLDNFIQFNLGQIGYQNPIVFFGFCISMAALLRNKINIGRRQKWLLIYTALPLILAAFCISLFKQVLPHWTGPSSISLILILSLWLDERLGFSISSVPNLIKAAIGLFCVVLVLATSVIFFYPGTIGNKEKENFGSGDFTLDMYGWNQVKSNFDAIAKKHPNTSIVLSQGWMPTAHFEQYLTKPLNLNIFAIGNINDIHQYHWWNNRAKLPADTFSAFLVIPSNYNFDFTTHAQLKNAIVENRYEFSIKRSNEEIQIYRVYVLKNLSKVSIDSALKY